MSSAFASLSLPHRLLLLLGGLLAAPAPVAAQAADRVPAEHWMQYPDVREAGFDPALLQAAHATWERLPSSAFLVVAGGAVVAAWGDVGRRFMLHSVRKSILTGLYGIYWDRGEIDLDQTLADLGLDDEPDSLLATEKQARILDLLKARSGVFHPAAYAGRTDSRPRGSEGPGRYFAYNNWDFNTAAAILMQEIGVDLFEAFDQHFGRPLEMEDWRVSDGYYHYERDKSKYPAYPFRMSARDLARFGLLYARLGSWGERRILSKHWVRRSSALYSIDDEAMGYGLMWWILREPRFARYDGFAALGVGNQMIAVFPEIDVVIVNRADTYRGQQTPTRPLLDLVEQVLEARRGAPAAAPTLARLEVPSDPSLTSVADERLREFVGAWPLPAAPLGLPERTTATITLGDGHLVSRLPDAGTFRLYLQPDGTLHLEDSHQRYLPVRDDSGAFAGLADLQSVQTAAILAAANGQRERAGHLLAMAESAGPLEAAVGRAVTDALRGSRGSAERRLRELAGQDNAVRVEGLVNTAGYVLLRNRLAERALPVFQLNARAFPDRYNTWDSLGEAHEALGHGQEAIRAYQRSLDLNPDNRSAREAIARIQAAEAARD